MKDASPGTSDDSDQDAVAEHNALLVQQYLSGDKSAASRLIQSNENKLFRAVLSFTGDFAQAQDVCQVAMLDAIGNLRKLNNPRAFYPWLHRIARNRAIQEMRSGKSRKNRDDLWVGEVQTQQIEADLGLAVEQAQTQEIIRTKLEQLPGLYRAILMLYYWRDEPLGEISVRLDIPVGTIKSYLHRARAILRYELEKGSLD